MQARPWGLGGQAGTAPALETPRKASLREVPGEATGWGRGSCVNERPVSSRGKSQIFEKPGGGRWELTGRGPASPGEEKEPQRDPGGAIRVEQLQSPGAEARAPGRQGLGVGLRFGCSPG